MNELLNSLKSDLLDRRLLPFLIALGLLFAGAVAYAALAGGGSSGSASPVAAVAPRSPLHSSVAVSQAPTNTNAAVSETAEGARYQRGGGAHDPFVALPSPPPPKNQVAATPSGGGSASSSSSSSSPSGGGQSTSTTPSGGGGTSPSQPAAPPKPKKVHKLTFTVAVLFGLAPTTPGQSSQLTPYASLKRLEPLPSAANALIVFEGVSSSRKNAIFTLAREAIVKGAATCLPSSLQCEAIDLAVGQSEQLQYVEPSGQAVTYELQLVSIAWHETTVTTNAKTARLSRRARAGRALLRRLDPPVQSHLRFSSSRGVLYYIARHGL